MKPLLLCRTRNVSFAQSCIISVALTLVNLGGKNRQLGPVLSICRYFQRQQSGGLPSIICNLPGRFLRWVFSSWSLLPIKVIESGRFRYIRPIRA